MEITLLIVKQAMGEISACRLEIASFDPRRAPYQEGSPLYVGAFVLQAVERRPYAILFGLHVEGRDRREVADSLGISGRQLRRDRIGAFEALASILRDRCLAVSTSDAPPLEEPLRSESERLAQQRETVDVHHLVSGLLPLLERMARERGVHLSCFRSYQSSSCISFCSVTWFLA